MKRVEYDPGFGWIARRRDGTEVMHDFRCASRAVARTVCKEADWADENTAARQRDQLPCPQGDDA